MGFKNIAKVILAGIIFIISLFNIDKIEGKASAAETYKKYLTGNTLEAYNILETYVTTGNETKQTNYFTDENVNSAMQAIKYAYPGRLDITYSSFHGYYVGDGEIIGTSGLSYDIASKSKNSQLASARNTFVSQLNTSGMTQAEICKLVHDKLISSITYELSGDQYSMVFSAYGALVDHKAVCDGIALAYKYILDYYGIDCLVVTGEAVGTDNPSNLVNHAWNMVKLDGDWYEIDCTWDLGSSDFTRGTLSYDYFLKTTSYMTSKNHKRTYLGTYLPTANGTKYAYTGESYNKNSIENTYGYPGILEDGLTDDELADYYYYPYGSTYTEDGVTYKIGKKATAEVIKVANRKKISISNAVGSSIKVTSIKADAFKGCTKLKELTIGAKYLNKIPSKMLVKCKKLKEFTLFTGKATSYSLKKVPKNLFNSKVKDKVKIWIGCDKSTKKTVYKKLRKLFIKAGYNKKKITWLQTRTE